MAAEFGWLKWWLVSKDPEGFSGAFDDSFTAILLLTEINRRMREGEYMRVGDSAQRFMAESKDLTPEQRAHEVLRTMGSSQVGLVENIYPYNGPLNEVGVKNAIHFCLWNRTESMSEEQVTEYLNKQFYGFSWLAFENVETEKSIPGIWHCHVIMLLESGDFEHGLELSDFDLVRRLEGAEV